jgi:hypothetical protein
MTVLHRHFAVIQRILWYPQSWHVITGAYGLNVFLGPSTLEDPGADLNVFPYVHSGNLAAYWFDVTGAPWVVNVLWFWSVAQFRTYGTRQAASTNHSFWIWGEWRCSRSNISCSFFYRHDLYDARRTCGIVSLSWWLCNGHRPGKQKPSLSTFQISSLHLGSASGCIKDESVPVLEGYAVDTRQGRWESQSA